MNLFIGKQFWTDFDYVRLFVITHPDHLEVMLYDRKRSIPIFYKGQFLLDEVEEAKKHAAMLSQHYITGHQQEQTKMTWDSIGPWQETPPLA